MLRAFIAVELNDEIRSAISALQGRVRGELQKELSKFSPDARLQWVKPQSIHLTLKFLGDIREDQVQAIGEAMTAALNPQAAFSLNLGGLGVFPDSRAPRVLWIGLEPASSVPLSAITALAGAVEQAMADLHFPREAKPFTPHLTLARIKECNREIGKALSNAGLLETTRTIGTLPVHSVSLIKSLLQPSGAVYDRLREVPLRGSD